MNKALTPRESEILIALVGGESNRVTAERLGISVRTVERHRARIMLKLRLGGVADAVKYAIRMGLIEP
jgi:DNA-binding NarL/FixJ family response regulator